MENELPKSIFREYSATISWLMPFAASYIKTSSSIPILGVLFGLLMLFAFVAGASFGVVGIFEFKETRKKSTIIQAIVGILINITFFVIVLFSALTSYLALRN